MKKLKRSGNMHANVDYELALAKEIDVQSMLSGHPNIVKLHEIIDDENDDKLYLVMEYAEKGQILDFSEETMKFTPNKHL